MSMTKTLVYSRSILEDKEKLMQRLKDIEGFIFDLDGTIYLESQLIEGALVTIQALREINKKVVFLTNNSSVNANYYLEKLKGMGIKTSIKEIYTSGQATAEYIVTNYPNKSVYLMGTRQLREEFENYGIKLTENMPDVAVLSYDKEISYDKLIKFTKYIVKGATYIATHADINCPAKDVYQPDIGSYMAMIKLSTGLEPTIICGKPYPPIAKGIMQRINLPAKKIAMVGDRLSTDIPFGKLNSFLSILVLSGESNMQIAIENENKPDIIFNSVYDILKYI